MSLLNQIESDFQVAFKAKEKGVVSTLRMLLAGLKNAKIQKKEDLNDQEVIKTIKSEVKKRQESIVEFEKANRPELADKEKEEKVLLEKYLPEQMNEDDVREKVKSIVDKLEDKDNLGKVMGAVMQEMKDSADGNLVRQIVEQEISK